VTHLEILVKERLRLAGHHALRCKYDSLDGSTCLADCVKVLGSSLLEVGGRDVGQVV
jgi:hypothetical protein